MNPHNNILSCHRKQGEVHGAITAGSFAYWPAASTHLGQASVYLRDVGEGGAGGSCAASGATFGGGGSALGLWPVEAGRTEAQYGWEEAMEAGMAPAPWLARRPEGDVFDLGLAMWDVLGGGGLRSTCPSGAGEGMGGCGDKAAGAPALMAAIGSGSPTTASGAEELWWQLPASLRGVLVAALDPDTRERATARALMTSEFVRDAMRGERLAQVHVAAGHTTERVVLARFLWQPCSQLHRLPCNLL